MNKEKGTQYELFVKDFLKNKYDNVWLWSELPESVLYDDGIIISYEEYLEYKNDIGIDIVAKKDNQYIYVQCKNYSKNNICINDLSGYYFFKSTFNKNCVVYYNGDLSQRIKKIGFNSEKYINLKYDNKNQEKEIITEKIMSPREYQLEAYNLLKNEKRCVLNLPCGMGKTYIGSLIATRYDNIIIFCPTKELANQTLNFYKNIYDSKFNMQLVSCDGTRNAEIITRNKKEKNILFSTYKSCDIIKNVISEYKNPLIIIDEFHNLSDNDVKNNANDFYHILNSDHVILFMSATPKYIDSKILGNTIYKYEWTKAIQNKYINDFTIYIPGGDYVDKNFNEFLDMFKVKNENNYDEKLVKKTYFILRSLLLNGNRKCIIYATSIENAINYSKIIHWMKNLFVVEITLGIIDCNTTMANRKKIINDFTHCSNIGIILNVQIMNEGIDLPCCDSVFITKLNNDMNNTIQRMSRCTRVHKNKNVSSVYLWCSKRKVDILMAHINSNTNGELLNKVKKLEYNNNKPIITENTYLLTNVAQKNEKIRYKMIYLQC